MLDPKLKSTPYSDSKLCLAMLSNASHQGVSNDLQYSDCYKNKRQQRDLPNLNINLLPVGLFQEDLKVQKNQISSQV